MPESARRQAWYTYVAPSGHLGVEVFFVLSGFLITSLLLTERKTSGKVDLRAFYWRRVRRIFPAYYFYIGVVGILGLTRVIHIPLVEWASNVFYLTDYTNGSRVWWTGHGWSLAVEEQFYLIWPAVLVVAGLTGAKKFAVAVVIASPAVRLATYFAFPAQRGAVNTMFHTRLDIIMTGCLLAVIWNEADGLKRWALGRHGTLTAYLAAAVVLGGVPLEARLGNAYKWTFGYSLTAIAVAALLAYVAARPASPFARLLSLGWLAWIGRISYSLYLWQQPFLTSFNTTPLGRFPINVLAAVATACLSYYFVERRFFRPVPPQIDRVGPDGQSLIVLRPLEELGSSARA